VLAEQAPELRQALERARHEGLPHVTLHGTVVPCDRCKEPTLSIKGEVIDLWYSGKPHTHGGNIQAVLAPGGFPLWVSQVEPGSVHDITAARLSPSTTRQPRVCPPWPIPAMKALASAFIPPSNSPSAD
jgi:DDE superfamily endonuclease